MHDVSLANQVMLREYKAKFHYLSSEVSDVLAGGYAHFFGGEVDSLGAIEAVHHTVHNRLCGESTLMSVVYPPSNASKGEVFYSLDQCAISMCSGSLLAHLAQQYSLRDLQRIVIDLMALGSATDERSRKEIIAGGVLSDSSLHGSSKVVNDFVQLSSLGLVYPMRKDCYLLNLKAFLGCLEKI